MLCGTSSSTTNTARKPQAGGIKLREICEKIEKNREKLRKIEKNRENLRKTKENTKKNVKISVFQNKFGLFGRFLRYNILGGRKRR